MNRLFLIVGPSGTGKSTLARNLSGNGVAEVVSWTSRAPRAGEVDGVDYRFTTPAEFLGRVSTGGMLEHVTYGGNHYGTAAVDVANALERGSACLVVESGGARQLKAALGERVRVLFLRPSDKETLRLRMLSRGDAPERVEARLASVDVEAQDGAALADFTLPPLSLESMTSLALRFIEGKPIRHVYVAGPYSGDTEGNTARALDAAEPLFRAGLMPYVPHLSHFWEQRHSHHYEEWMDLDFAWLSKCDALLRLPGHSIGADREVAFARANKIPVFHDADALLCMPVNSSR